MHNSMLTGAHRVQENLTGHEELCKKNFRMEVGVLGKIHRLVTRRISQKNYVNGFSYA